MFRPNDYDKTPHAIPPSTWEYVQSPRIARDYDLYYQGTRLLDFDSQVLDSLIPNPGTLLDLGCGTGRHVLQFARRGFDVTGLDLSPHMLRVTRDKLEAESLKADLVPQDLCDLSRFDSVSFDYVICMFSTLGLIRGRAHRTDVLRQVRRLLKPGGLLVLHVHNRWFNLFDREGRAWLLRNHFLMPFQGYELGDRIFDNLSPIPHMYLHIFSLREVRRMLWQAGFSSQAVICLNRARDAELPKPFLRSLRSNGFIFSALA